VGSIIIRMGDLSHKLQGCTLPKGPVIGKVTGEVPKSRGGVYDFLPGNLGGVYNFLPGN